MKKILIIAILLSTVLTFAKAQDVLDWEPTLPKYTLTDSLKKYSSVYALLEKKIDIGTDAKKKVYCLLTNHFIIIVNDDKGIEETNTFSFIENKEYVELKARSIQPNGKIIEVSGDKIKEKTNDDGRKIKLIALEGLEKGSVVEVISVEKTGVREFGSYDFQFTKPILKAKFELATMDNVLFEAKSYNGFTKAKEVFENGRRYLTAEMDDIPALESEDYAYYSSKQMKVDYRLSYFKNRPDNRLNTWQNLVDILYEKYYKLDDKNKKAVEKFLESNKVDLNASASDKIIAIENLIKEKMKVIIMIMAILKI
jgi:hypothetical protein